MNELCVPQAPGLAGSAPVDVAVIGAGLAGASIATLLARAGHAVALVDSRARMLPEFRAEKLGQMHLDLFDGLGLGPAVRPSLTPTDEAMVYRFGRLVSRAGIREYGFSYANLVNGLRDALPPEVRFIVGRVAAATTGEDRQRVTFSDGSFVQARLLVVATGLGDAIRRNIGIRKVETGKSHSLSLGFTLARPARHYAFENLTYYAPRQPSRLAYTTLFRLEDTIRANLFVYRTAGDAWTKRFVAEPAATMCELMPEIADLCGGFAVDGDVKVRPIDLIATEDYRRPGVVLVGDAFRTTCPVPGVGIRRAMTDVGRLCTDLVPRWLASPGMGRDKIDAFYDDPAKRAMDALAVRSSLYARQMATGTGVVWSARRLRNDAARRSQFRIKALWQHLPLGRVASNDVVRAG